MKFLNAAAIDDDFVALKLERPQARFWGSEPDGALRRDYNADLRRGQNLIDHLLMLVRSIPSDSSAEVGVGCGHLPTLPALARSSLHQIQSARLEWPKRPPLRVG